MSLLNVEAAVRKRYSAAAQDRVAELCCPVDYDRRYLAAIPAEILERDYGCGDPSKYVQPGETVLDLGSGGGKVCYIAAQVVGPTGRVIGVDCNVEMLKLARRHQPEIAQRLGFDNVEFRHGRIQDLKLDLDRLHDWLQTHPVHSVAEWTQQQAEMEMWSRAQPLVADNSIDVVVSNCVLNLVRQEDRRQLFQEMFRTMKPGGRAVISDITADREVPAELQADETLWSGCISGAYLEADFLRAFEAAGFVAVEMLVRQSEPWTTVAGIEFRSVTVRAFKPLTVGTVDIDSPAKKVIYRGPWKSVEAELGLRLERGRPTLVTPQQAAVLSLPAYHDQVLMPMGQGTPTVGGPLPLLDAGMCCGPHECC